MPSGVSARLFAVEGQPVRIAQNMVQEDIHGVAPAWTVALGIQQNRPGLVHATNIGSSPRLSHDCPFSPYLSEYEDGQFAGLARCALAFFGFTFTRFLRFASQKATPQPVQYLSKEPPRFRRGAR